MPRIVRAFHGTTLTKARAILSGSGTFLLSTNAHDWLGHGVYFFEESQALALDWARGRVEELKLKGVVDQPAVIAATLDLDRCLDLCDGKWGAALSAVHRKQPATIPLQHGPALKTAAGSDVVIRDVDVHSAFRAYNFADCRVLDQLVANQLAQGRDVPAVRGAFIDGQQLYTNSYLFSRTHVQIAVRDMAIVTNPALVYPPAPAAPLTGAPQGA